MYRLLLTTLTSLTLAMPAHARSSWRVEAEKGGSVTWLADSVADIHAPGGLTLWHTALMRGNVSIDYEARICSDGRVSDLNCFWMASDPQSRDVFGRAGERGGRFVQSYGMQLYYMGYGGNYNKTTRFRRYTADTRGIDNPQYRPSILREYLDSAHMIKGDHWYKIHLEQRDGHALYVIDGDTLVDYVDPHPLTQGYFGFRTTLAHAQLRRFRYQCDDVDARPIKLTDVFRADSHPLPRPTTFGVPFAQGELPASSSLTLTASGSPVASDQWPLATWPDGSVKWQAVAAVLPSSSGEVLLHKTLNNKKKQPRHKATLETPRVYPSADGHLLDSLVIGGHHVVDRLWVEQDGEMQPVRSVTREQEGPVRSTWRFDGENFTVRLYTYTGSNEVKLVHTFFVDSLTNARGLGSLAIMAQVPMQGWHHERAVCLATTHGHERMSVQPLESRRPITLDADGAPANDLTRSMLHNIARWDGFRLSQLTSSTYTLRKRATSASPWIGTAEGSDATGQVVVGHKRGATAFHLEDFRESYPSTLQVDSMRSDEATVSLYLWSPESERMMFEHYDTVAHGLEAAYEDVQPGMSTAHGIARTSTVYIYGAPASVDSLAALLPSLRHHAQYLPQPEYLHRKRAFGIWSLPSGSALDSEIDSLMRFYERQQESEHWYGYFNYGDFMHTRTSDLSGWRYDVGGYAWDNTELATPLMLWYQFLRTGQPTLWRMATAMTRHNSEVDCYHRGPFAGLGSRHNVLHWGCGAKEARISQAGFNRIMYYLTADERLGDIMHEVVDLDTLLLHLDPMRLAQPRSAQYPCTAPARLRVGPDWISYAANWFTEWERTGNVRYRDKILRGMQSIASLPHGLNSGPKALGYDPATGVISWEGDSAVQNTNHLLTIMGGFEMMTEMMLSLSTPEWERAWLTHAADYKQKALAISRNHFRVPRLGALAWWQLGRRDKLAEAWRDTYLRHPLRFTNDAATFTLDAIFLQEVGR